MILGCTNSRNSLRSMALRSSVSSDRLLSLDLSIAVSYTTAPSLRDLAVYIATSAMLSSASPSLPCSG